ncbi:glycosyltransferase family 2 protein [Actinotalea sp. BY-33]|uniref:Glycosyltransferase family 2 protein n=1 Tax=Actinotalea soli TaxID=2819234 RepID=A0A939LNG8_9CELL|nr:glycosyltransferase family 2 protein [Actinotalea soli]MBO1750673.1 glycosyltransferase family 2 protein [Actinotalea soli]
MVDHCTTSAPLISIGVPVYNGAAFLVPALESLLAQTVSDLEIVISDNGSTDATEQLCREVAARDPRVLYVRQPTNYGGAANFNAVFALRHPGARYFKWAAADDVHEPGYLAAVLQLLESDPTVSVAHSRTDDVDEHGGHVRAWGDQSLEADHPDVAVRFASLSQRNYQCFSIFGLMRAEVLASTRGLGLYSESDRVLLAELSLRGRLVDVPEVLFHRRQHAGRSVRQYRTARERIAWFNPRLVGRPVFPEWRLGRGYLEAVLRAPLSTVDRTRCMAQMLRWTRLRTPHLVRNVLRSALDLAAGRVAWRGTRPRPGTPAGHPPTRALLP